MSVFSRLSFWVLLSFLCLGFLGAAHAASADQDLDLRDKIVFNLAAEDWVETQTVRVVVAVEASVSGKTELEMRKDMTKTLPHIAKADWRLTQFVRNMSSTGLENWRVLFEARVPENKLVGLAEQLKKDSKAGMQFEVQTMDFTPTLAEKEAALAGLRAKLYARAKEQLAQINAAFPGKNYKLALIDFSKERLLMGAPTRTYAARAPQSAMLESASAASGMTRSQKLSLTASVVVAAP